MKLGRRSRRFFYTLGALVLLMGALHTRPAKAIALRLLTRIATSAFGGSASVDSLDYRLWLGQATLHRVVFEPHPDELPVSVSADRLVVRLSGLRLSASLESPRVTYIESPESSDDTDPSVVLGLLGDVHVSDGTFSWHDPNERLTVSGIDLDALVATEAHRITAHGREGRLFVGDREIRFGATDADATLGARELNLASVAVFLEESFVRAEGSLRFSGPVVTDLDVSFALDGTLARTIDAELDLEGVLSGEGRVHVEQGAPILDVEARSDRIAASGVTVNDVSVRVHLDEDELALRPLTAKVFGGTAKVEAEIPFETAGTTNLDLDLMDIDASAAAAEIADATFPVASRVGGELHLAIPEWDLSRAAGRAELRLSGDAAGTMTLSLESGIVTMSTTDTTLPTLGGELAVNGRVGLDGGIELDGDAQADLALLASRFAPDLPVTISGRGEARGHVEGSLAEPRWIASVSTESFFVDDRPFVLTASANGSLDRIELEAASLIAQQGGQATANGSIPLREGSWGLDVDIDSLALPAVVAVGESEPEVSGQARLSGPASEPQVSATFRVTGLRLPDPLEGNVSLDVGLEGPLGTLDGRAELQAREITLNRASLPSLSIEAVSDLETVHLTGRRDDGTLLLTGVLLLTEPYVLTGEIPLSALPWNEIVDSLKPTGMMEAQWSAEGTLHFEVPLKEPASLLYHAAISSLLGVYGLTRIEATPFVVDGSLSLLEVEGLELRGTRNHASIEGTIPFVPEESFDLAIEGDLDLAALGLLFDELEIAGQGRAELRVQGTGSSPSVVGSLVLEDGFGRFHELEWSDMDISLSSDEGTLPRLSLSAMLLGGRIQIDGRVPLRARSGAASLDWQLQSVELRPFLPDALGSVSLVTSASGTIDVPELDWASWEGSGRIDELYVAERDASVALAEPALWELSSGALRIPAVRLEGDRTRLFLSLDSLRLDEAISISTTAEGHLDLAILNPALAAKGIRVGGEVDVSASIDYDGDRVFFEGSGDLRGGRFRLARPAFSVTDANARIDLAGSTVTLENLEARAGSGNLQGEGTLDWSDVSSPRIQLTARAVDVPLELMEGLRSQVSGDIRLANRDDALELSGSLVVDRGLFTREFEEESSSIDTQFLTLRDPTEERGLADELSLSLVIGTRRPLRVENSMAQLEVEGSVSIGGTLASPELGGFITLVPDGTFNVGRNRFQIIQGRVDLTGTPVVPPRITVLALTRVGSTVINLDVDGDTDDLATRLTAPENPELTEGDLASLLVTGRTLEKASEGGQQMASTWMMSSMANLLHEGLGDLISFGPPPGAGPLILSEEADPTSRLTLGFPVTERLSITYSIALDDTERRLWILDYRLARNFWLRGIQENSNDYSVGFSQRFDIDVRGRAQRETESARPIQRVASFEILGVEPDLARTDRIRPGARYDYWAVRDEAEEVQEALVDDGYLSAVVDVETTERETDGGSEVDVVLRVEAGSRIDLSWRGDDPGKEIQEMVRRRWDGRIPEEFLLDELTGRALARLKTQRYFDARLSHRVEQEGDLRRVIFELERGPRGERVEIAFAGNETLDDESLLDVLPPPKTPEFFRLLERPDQLERGFRLRYASMGYLDTTVQPPTTSFDGQILRVEISVDEGDVTRVAQISFEGLTAHDPERLTKELGVEEGAPVDFARIRQGQTSIRTLYRNEGFPEVRLRSEIDRDPSGLRVKVILDEGARAQVGQIRVVGNLKTAESVILNELTFGSGDPIRMVDFQETQKRLYDLGIFRSADVRPDSSQSGQEVQDVLIQVVERADLDVNYGLRENVVTSEQSADPDLEPKSTGLEGVLRATFINAFSRGMNIGFSGFVQQRHQLYRGTFRVPTFFRRRLITEVILESEREIDRLEIAGFDSRARAITFQQTKKLRDDRYDRYALQWNFRYSRYVGKAVSESGELFELQTYRPRFGVSLIEDQRDSFANPTRGRFWNLTAQYVPGIWGSDLSYVRLYGQIFHYYPLTQNVVWASSYRLGAAQGSKEILLIQDRFQAGGANSVRGFEQNTLGPSVILENGEELFIGGQAVAVFNQEIRVPIYKALAGGVFWDAGNVFARASDFNFSELKHSAGAGIRFVLPFGAIRLDWARVLNPDDDDKTSRWHFAFGYAF